MVKSELIDRLEQVQDVIHAAELQATSNFDRPRAWDKDRAYYRGLIDAVQEAINYLK